MREQYADTLNLHTGTLTDLTDPNNELIYQIALEALSTMNYDAVCLGPQDLYLPVDIAFCPLCEPSKPARRLHKPLRCQFKFAVIRSLHDSKNSNAD